MTYLEPHIVQARRDLLCGSLISLTTRDCRFAPRQLPRTIHADRNRITHKTDPVLIHYQTDDFFLLFFARFFFGAVFFFGADFFALATLLVTLIPPLVMMPCAFLIVATAQTSSPIDPHVFLFLPAFFFALRLPVPSPNAIAPSSAFDLRFIVFLILFA